MGRFLMGHFWSKIEGMNNNTEQNLNSSNTNTPKTKITNLGAGIICAVVMLAVVGVVGYVVVNNAINAGKTDKETIKTTFSLDDYDTAKIIEGDSNNGNIGDHVRGNADSKVVLVEYADFQCPGCASMMSRVDKIYLEYKDRVAFIYRNYPISYHENAMSAAKAAEAAGYQGKFWEMAKYLYANRADWIAESGDTLMKKYEENFKYAAPDGDLEKFRKDMNDENIKKKIEFDYSLGNKRDGVNATPAFFINGEKASTDDVVTFADYENLIREMLDKALEKAE